VPNGDAAPNAWTQMCWKLMYWKLMGWKLEGWTLGRPIKT
jgi:hypothetical protein